MIIININYISSFAFLIHHNYSIFQQCIFGCASIRCDKNSRVRAYSGAIRVPIEVFHLSFITGKIVLFFNSKTSFIIAWFQSSNVFIFMYVHQMCLWFCAWYKHIWLLLIWRIRPINSFIKHFCDDLKLYMKNGFMCHCQIIWIFRGKPEYKFTYLQY